MTNTTKTELLGFDEFQKLLEELPADLASGVIKKAFYQGASVVKEAAVQKCPVGPAENRHTEEKYPPGSARDSIRIVRPTAKQSLRDTMLLYILKAGGKKAPHANIVEFGTGPRMQKNGRFTGSMPAQPFMRPAFDERAGNAIDRIGMYCKAGIERAAVAVAKRTGALK